MFAFKCMCCGRLCDDGSSMLKLCLDCLDKINDGLDDELPDPKEHGYFSGDDFITERI